MCVYIYICYIYIYIYIYIYPKKFQFAGYGQFALVQYSYRKGANAYSEIDKLICLQLFRLTAIANLKLILKKRSAFLPKFVVLSYHLI